MSMISEQVKRLREKAKLFSESDFAVDGIVKDYNDAADTIEELSKKLAVGNGGWIPCSKKLPEEDVLEDGYVEPSEAVLVLTKYNSYKVSRYWGNRRNKRDYHDWVDIEYRKNEVIAWKHITPYQPKEQ